MIKTKALFIVDGPIIPGLTVEQLYMISYQNSDSDEETALYIGQSNHPVCRLSSHFGVNNPDCKWVSNRSGAAKQLNKMINQLPKDLVRTFNITLFEAKDVLEYSNFDNYKIRRMIISNKVAVSDIHYNNNKNTKVLEVCEAELSQIFKPTFCQATYSRWFKSSPLPSDLIRGYTKSS